MTAGNRFVGAVTAPVVQDAPSPASERNAMSRLRQRVSALVARRVPLPEIIRHLSGHREALVVEIYDEAVIERHDIDGAWNAPS